MYKYKVVERGNYDDFRRQIEAENYELCLVAEDFERELAKSKNLDLREYLEFRLAEIYSQIKTEDDIIELWRGY